jgi:polyhydroxyalkanoate synthesis regulator phasin
MAPSKTTRDSKKKRATKTTKPRYYIVKTAQEARTNLTGKLEDYNRKYIVEPLRSGKTIVKELKAEPRKVAADLLDDGKTRISDLNKEVWTRVDGVAKDGKAFLTKAGKNPREAFNDLIDESKELVDDLRSSTRDKIDDLMVDIKILKEGLEKDTQLVVADLIDGSKKVLNQVPGKQRIEKEISSRMVAMPAKFNLPSRKDIERLARQVKQLNTKVDALNKAQAA